jgi:glycosyltransferase involved in cell wall biosynthesis
MSKNICHIVHNFYPQDVRVRKEIVALVKKGHKVSVIALGRKGEPVQECIKNVKVYRLALDKKRSGKIRYLFEYVAFLFYSLYKLNLMDIKENFDVVHVSTLPDFLVFCALIQKLKGCKIILDMHEIAPEFFMSKFGVGKGNLIVRLSLFLEKMSLRFADDVITINDSIKNIFNKRAIPSKQISVVMNTMDGDMVARKSKVPHKSYNCVYHGTLTDIYGLDTALKGFSEACRHKSDMFFHIFGNGPQLPELKRLSIQLSLQNCVVFHGEVSHSKMIEYLYQMDLGILAIRKDVFLNLSFSNKLSEYLYIKIPVIHSNLDATKYYFSDDHILYFEAGNISELADRIKFAYSNRDYMKTVAEAAYERALLFDWSIMAKRYLQVVEK